MNPKVWAVMQRLGVSESTAQDIVTFESGGDVDVPERRPADIRAEAKVDMGPGEPGKGSEGGPKPLV